LLKNEASNQKSNKLKTGCSPCLEQVNKIIKQKNFEIQSKENKKIVSWIFDIKR
jgi:hypothetical protein